MTYRRHFRFLPALLALLVLVNACGRMQAAHPAENPNFVLSLTVQPSPPLVGDARLVITLADRAGHPVEAARVHVEGNMAHVGMKPVFADSTSGQAGHYEVPLTWTMGGDWVVDVTATLADGQTAHRQFPVRVTE